MSTFRSLWLVTLILLAAAAEAVTLPFKNTQQEGTFLCWAAAAETAWSSLGQTNYACDILSTALAPRQCCTINHKVVNTLCDEPTPFVGDYLPAALDAIRWGNGVAIEPIEAFVDFEIRNGRPVAVWWRFSVSCKASGHVVTVVGIEPPTSTSPTQVLISDPRVVGGAQADWDYLRCGPARLGHCAVYMGIGGTEVTGTPVQELQPCPRPPVIAGDALDLDAVVAKINEMKRPAMMERLGLAGNVGCAGEVIEAELGELGVQGLLAPCSFGPTRILAGAVPLEPHDVDVLWFGATLLRARIDAAKGRVPGRGQLVLRVLPETGEMLLFRKDDGHPVVLTPGLATYAPRGD